MLTAATDAVYSTEEFQRGTANYLHAYEKAWQVYFDFAEQYGDPEHPVFQTGTFRTRKAPGIYQNGELVQIPSTFHKSRPRSAYGIAKIRERAGLSQDPKHDFVTKEATNIRRGYEKDWKKNYLKRNPLASNAEVDAHVEKLTDEHLRKSGFDEKTIARRKESARGIPELPEEAKVTEHDEGSFARNVDARDRGAVATAVNDNLGLEASSIKDLEKQVKVKEIVWGSRDAGFPQVLEFNTTPKVDRGELEKPVRAGLVFAEQVQKGETLEPKDVHVLEYQKVEEMMDALHNDPLYKPLLENRRFFTQEHERIFATLDRAPDKFGAAPYLNLNVALNDTSPYPLDTLIDIHENFFPAAKSVIEPLSRMNFDGIAIGGFPGVVENWSRLDEQRKEVVKMISENKEIKVIPPYIVSRVLQSYFPAEKEADRENFLSLLKESAE